MTLYHSTGIIAASGGAAAKPGMVLLTPTSIAHSGTSASIGANGQVTFTAVTSLSLNGVFSATYDNYVISMRHVASSGVPDVWLRWRASGTDASGSNYTRQYLVVNSTTISAARQTSFPQGYFVTASSTQRSGTELFIYGPFLAQPTAARSIQVIGENSAYMLEQAGTHSLSTSYDGVTFTVDLSQSISGAVQVYGVRS